MTPAADKAPQPAERPTVRRGPRLLLRIADIRKLNADWVTTQDVLQLFRDAQRIGR